jgi:hypothetical protein
MPLDMTGMTLTADERGAEAVRILERLRFTIETATAKRDTVRGWSFSDLAFAREKLIEYDLFSLPPVMSPKQLLWLRDLAGKVD